MLNNSVSVSSVCDAVEVAAESSGSVPLGGIIVGVVVFVIIAIFFAWMLE